VLSSDEEKQLNVFTMRINQAKENDTYPYLGAYDVEWLATRLQELNEELKIVKPSVASLRREGENLTAELNSGRVVIAKWNGERYWCVLCSTRTYSDLAALQHISKIHSTELL
jgi:hypothetical protein